MLVTAYTLGMCSKANEKLLQLRKDLDLVRKENRKIKEQLGALEARVKSRFDPTKNAPS